VNALQRRAIVSRRVVKDIRPGLLPAVVSVGPDVPVVLVVRDPVAVARSRARLETSHGDWFRTEAALAELRSRAEGPDTGLGRLARRAVAILDGPLGGRPLVDHVVLWCVENTIALAVADRPGRGAVVRYEELRADPDAGFARLADAIGLAGRSLGDPSATSSTDFRAGRDVEVGAADVADLVEIVTGFGLDRFLAGAPADRRPR
jgi:hypothetical protein